MQASERRQQLRQVLGGRECVFSASVHDPVSALLAESFGFKVGMLSGSVASLAVLGAPDLVVLTLTEFADLARRITRASDLPVMADADHGYGNALNAMRTVEELEAAGISGLTIEDTKLPIGFGSPGKSDLISTAEMVGKLRAGLTGRRDPSLCVLARSAGLPIEGVERTVERVKAYSAAGVDAVFVVGVRTMADVEALHRATPLPLILGGRPQGMDDVKAMAANGVRVALQGNQPYAAAIKAVHDVYEHLAKGGSPSALRDKVASDEMMARVSRKPAYDAWMRDFLGA